MGNKLVRKKQVVDERYTRPQGLYNHKDVDNKKLRKLILESKLAPCYPGDDECCQDLEECPICFLYYPSLNRSRCCLKGICTECFLQMKNPSSTRPTQCPFCKASNYAVEYRGRKTKEEKGVEQIEEQRVIEAKIRMRQKQLQDDEERMQKRRESSSSSTNEGHGDEEYDTTAVASARSSVEGQNIVSFQDLSTASTVRQASQPRESRDDEFALDLEDIMMFEAFFLSSQESGMQRNPAYDDMAVSQQLVGENRYDSAAMTPMTPMTPMAGTSVTTSSSPSGGLACAIAALAERQQTDCESTNSRHEIPSSSEYYNRMHRDAVNYPPDQGLELAEAETSYTSSSVTQDPCEVATLQHHPDEFSSSNPPSPIIPKSFEEQMMLAMAVSLAEDSSVTQDPCGVSTLQHHPDEISGSFQNLPSHIIPESFDEQMMLAMAVSLAEGSSVTQDSCRVSTLQHHPDDISGSFQNLPSPIIPESFEEQMMLAMAVSLAEARVVKSGAGVPQQ